ncbi:MAG: sulfotransferase [Candidatus Thorarchaeota archaeon]
MKIKRTSKGNEFDFPAPMYFLAKIVQDVPHLASTLHRLESSWMNSRMSGTQIKSPIYITGLARSGTTVVLEMLSQHKDIASHRYLHMVLPYAPHWFQRLADYVPIMTIPSERLHKDGLFVTRDSPEAVEETFWQEYFDNALDESLSNVLGSNASNPKFEDFYQANIKKLLINRKSSRYLAKNNYNVTRMEYLLKLFPDTKFVIMIRNPFDHIASLAKQDAIFKEMEANDPRLLEWTKLIGHREFGSAKVCINLDNTETVQKIRELWESKETYVEGWAIYWASIYEHVHRQIQENPSIKKAALVVRYEDLCDSPSEVIDKIIGHTGIDPESFLQVKQHYCNTLRRPTYYKTTYSKKEQDQIISTAGDVASRFGYDL